MPKFGGHNNREVYKIFSDTLLDLMTAGIQHFLIISKQMVHNQMKDKRKWGHPRANKIILSQDLVIRFRFINIIINKNCLQSGSNSNLLQHKLLPSFGVCQYNLLKQ